MLRLSFHQLSASGASNKVVVTVPAADESSFDYFASGHGRFYQRGEEERQGRGTLERGHEAPSAVHSAWIRGSSGSLASSTISLSSSTSIRLARYPISRPFDEVVL